jgi:hypothetical protein
VGEAGQSALGFYIISVGRAPGSVVVAEKAANAEEFAQAFAQSHLEAIARRESRGAHAAVRRFRQALPGQS